MVVTEVARGENSHVTEVVSLMEGEWLSYEGGQFSGGRMVINLCYSGDYFNGGKMVRLQRWPLYWKENGHVREVVS